MRRLFSILSLILLCASAAWSQTITVVPGNITWDKVKPGSTQTTAFKIKNLSLSTPISGSFDSVVAPFSIVEGSTFTLDTNEEKVFTARYMPTDFGVLVDTVVIRGNGGSIIGHVNLYGVAINIDTAHVVFSTDSLDFGVIPVDTRDTVTFTITNPTPSSLLKVTVLTSLDLPFQVIKGGGPHSITETPLTVSVIFAPYEVGTFNNMLHVSTNDKANPDIYLPLHGVAGVNDVRPNVSQQQVRLYPTVTNTAVQMTCEQPFSYEVHDLLGRLVAFSGDRSTSASLDVRSLAPGIYLCKLQTQNGTQYSRFEVIR